MNDIADPGLQRRFERLERLFALSEPKRYAEHALLTLLDAAEAPTGYAVLHPQDGAPVAAAVRGRRTRAMRKRLRGTPIAAAVRARLDDPTPVIEHTDPHRPLLADPLGEAAVVSVRVEHGEGEGRSLWVLGREAPFEARALVEVEALVAAVANLGALMLPRLPGGVAGYYARRALTADVTARRASPDLLDGLPRIAADCARLAARGYTNRQIGGYLLMAESVVARYLTAVYRHLEIEGRYQLDAELLLAGPKPPPRVP